MSPGVLLTGFSDYGGLGENVDWQLAPVLTGFYHGYMASSDTHYVDMMVTCVDTLISLETIEPDGYPGWPATGAGGTGTDDLNYYYADSMLGDAAAFRPIVLMAYQMTTNPLLKATYGAKGQSYLALAETLYQKWVWRGGWRDTTYPGGMISVDLPEGMDPATGYTTWITNPATNFADSPGQNSYTSANEYGPTWIAQAINNGMSHPTNKADEVALWLLAMWDVTGNPEYQLRASKWFTYLKNYRMTLGDEWTPGLDGSGDLIWNYWEPAGSWDFIANQAQNDLYDDNGIGNTKTWTGTHPNNGYYWIDTQCIVAAFEHGVVFNEADITTLVTDAKTSWTPSAWAPDTQYYFNPSSLSPGMSVSAYPASGTVQQVAGCIPNSLTPAASAVWPSVVAWNGGSYPSPLNGTIVSVTWNGSTGTIVVKPTGGGANVTLDTNTSTEVWLLRMWGNFLPYDTQIQQQFEANEDTNPATAGSWGAVDDSFFLWLHSTLTVQSTPPTGLSIVSSMGQGYTTNYTIPGAEYNPTVNLQAPAADPAGYTFAQWAVNGTAQTAGLKSITFGRDGPTTAVAQYVPNYLLTVQSTPPTGLSISSSTGDAGTTNYTVADILQGTSVKLAAPATDPAGYTFSKWTVNGTAQTAGLKSITFAMTAATTAAAQYTLNTYALTVQSTPATGIVITSSSADGGTTNYTVPSVGYGTSVNLAAPATDPTGYTFSQWTVNGTAQTAGLKSITFTMTAATTAVAQYTTNSYVLTVQSTPPTGIAITSTSGDGGTTNYTVTSVAYGASVKLAAPATDPAGYTFSQWTVNGTAQTAGQKSITFAMPAGAAAVAQYTLNTYTLNVESIPPAQLSIGSSTGHSGITNYSYTAVAYGTSVNLVAPATDPVGYTFMQWTLNNTATGGAKSITFTMTAATTAAAQYSLNTYALTVQSTPPTGLSIGSSTGDGGTTNYTVPSVGYATGVNLSAPKTDPVGYTFSQWTVSGVAQTAGLKSITFPMPAAAATAAAQYTLNTYTLTVQATPPTGVTITSSSADGGTTNYTVPGVGYGTSVNLQAPATDPTGYTFSQWTVNGTAQTVGLKSITFTMTAATTAAAQYTLNTYALTVQSAPPTGIVISSTSGDSGTTNYTVPSVGYATSVNLAAPATDPTGYTFSQWTVNGTAQTAGLKSITFTMPAAAVTAAAQYTLNTYPLTVQSTPLTGLSIGSNTGDSGTTNYTASGVGYGTSVNLQAPATDPTGYTFSKWTVNGTAQTAGLKSITFTMAAAATTAVAQYTLNTYTLTVQSTPPTGVVVTSSSADGGKTNYSVSSVGYGTSITLAAPATDPAGYTFSQWTVNGTAQTAGLKSITFTMPAAAVTVAAQYTLNTYTLTVQSTPPTGVVIASSGADGGTTNYTVSSVGYGTSVNLAAPATDPAGYAFSKWTVNGTAQTAGQKTIAFTMTSTTTASAQYTVNFYALTVQSTPLTGVAIASSGGEGGKTNYTISSLAYGLSVTLAAPATDPAGYTFSQWTMNGTAQTAGLKSITFTMPAAATTAAAQYTLNTYALTVQSTPPTGIVIGSSSGDGWTTNYTISSVGYGTSVNLAAPATDPAGYAFSKWTVNGTAQTAGLKSITFTVPAAAVTAAAQYTPVYPLSVQSTPPTGLVIGSSSGDGWTTNYTMSSVLSGTSVNLAAPAMDPTGYTFSQWTVNSAAQTAGLKSITFTMTAATIAVAQYTTNIYPMTVQSTPPTGVVITSSSADGGTTNYTIFDVAYGASVNLEAPATDPSGYTFSQWTLNGVAQTSGKSITFTMGANMGGVYLLDGFGGVHPVGNVPAFSGGPYWAGFDIARALRVVFDSTGPVQGYYVLDGYGGVHPVGNVPAFSGGPYWPGFDIAKDMDVVYNSTGTVQGYYILDGYGAVHPVGNVPAFSGGPYWGGFDIARALAVVYNSAGTVQGYYVLDGYGGVHPVGNVPAFSGPYWFGFDIARALKVVFDSTGTVQGYYVLDGCGCAHAVGNVPAFSGGPYWPGWDIAVDMDLVYNSTGTVQGYYVMDGYGCVHPVGNVATISGGPYWPGWDIGRALSVNRTTATTAVAQYVANSYYTLTVQSTPPTGLGIGSSTGNDGTTSYSTQVSVAPGTSVNLQAPATDPTGYTFLQWTVNGAAQTAGQKAITFTITANTTAAAQYSTLVGRTDALPANANTPMGAQDTPNASSGCTLTVQSAPPTRTLITSSTADGGMTNYTVSSVAQGTSVTLQAPATDPVGYTFAQWTLNGTARTAGQKAITFTVPSATTAVAQYTANTYALAVQATPATGIVITSSTACGGTTNYTAPGIAYGTVVNLAAPATDPAGYTFSQWTLTGGQQPIAFTTSADLKSITFAISADITAVAVYVKDAP
jgi:hypothetical protein